MAFPPAHFLVGAGFADLVRVFHPLPKWKSRLIAGSVAVMPDLDVLLGLLGERAGSAYHGTFTHSIFAAAVVGLAAWMMAGKGWGVLAGSAYGSHLIVDLLDEHGRTNVLLGWPFTHQYPYALARVFPPVNFLQGRGAIPAALSLLDPPVFRELALQTLVGAAIMLLLFVAARLLLLVRERRRGELQPGG